MKTLLGGLRSRILLLVLCVGLIPVSISGFIFFHFYERLGTAPDVVSITSEAQLLSNQIVTSGYLQDPSVESLNTQFSALSNIYTGRVIVCDASLKVIKDSYNIYEGRTFVWENAIRSLRGETTTLLDRDSHCIIVTVPILAGDSSEPHGVLLFTKSTEYLEQNSHFFMNLIFYLILVGAIISAITALLASERLTRPLRNLSQSLAQVQEEESPRILSISGTREVADITEKFNTILMRMKGIDDSRQEFVSNVSHELKTPLTSMKVLADSINSMGGDAPLELYQEFMADITTEIDRETKIINDLLSLVRMDRSGSSLNISSVNINELVEMILKRLRPIAEKQQIQLVLESFRPITAEIDEVKISLAISNLIENGIKYNSPQGFVHVSLNSDHRYCYIRVEDSGLGIPEEDIGRIFERFFRVDKSHSRKIGGTGLGLAITKNAIDMHHGQIQVHSVLGEGSCFDIRLPLNYIEDEREEKTNYKP